MSRYIGEIGFSFTNEAEPGVWVPQLDIREYKGSIIRGTNRFETEKINNDLSLDHAFSIIGDAFILENASKIVFVSFAGERWIANSIEIHPPRVIINTGGIYNG